jgi:hypothetical protein
MTLDHHVIEATMTTPLLHTHLNEYAETGLKTYARMIEFDLKILKQQYGQEVYDKLNHIYQGIRGVVNGN